MTHTFDEKMLQHAVQLALKARVIAPPNPWVGCVIVKSGAIIGEGHTLAPGREHAEIKALEQAGQQAQGATAYITLEPCCHHGKTPPCTQALIRAQIKRVVIGLVDPDTRVAGAGIKELERAGIAVTVNICQEQVSKLLTPYLYQRRTGLPYCLAKAAVSIDGRIAAADGSSQWLTGEEARRDAHRLRAESQAILIGSGTAIKDRPSLTVRYAVETAAKPPLRVVLDARGTQSAPAPLFDRSQAETLIVSTPLCPKATLKAWARAGAQVEIVKPASDQRGVDLLEVLQLLGKREVLQLLVEGGSTLLGSFLKQSLLQQICLYVAPCILGSNGIPLFQFNEITTLSSAPKLSFQQAITLGSAVRLEYTIDK